MYSKFIHVEATLYVTEKCLEEQAGGHIRSKLLRTERKERKAKCSCQDVVGAINENWWWCLGRLFDGRFYFRWHSQSQYRLDLLHRLSQLMEIDRLYLLVSILHYGVRLYMYRLWLILDRRDRMYNIKLICINSLTKNYCDDSPQYI